MRKTTIEYLALFFLFVFQLTFASVFSISGVTADIAVCCIFSYILIRPRQLEFVLRASVIALFMDAAFYQGPFVTALPIFILGTALEYMSKIIIVRRKLFMMLIFLFSFILYRGMSEFIASLYTFKAGAFKMLRADFPGVLFTGCIFIVFYSIFLFKNNRNRKQQYDVNELLRREGIIRY